MKTKEQISSDSTKFKTPPKDYNLLEIHCFLALRQLLIMFKRKQIEKDDATKIKNRILSEYEKQVKNYKFQLNMFQEHIDNLKKTEHQRTTLEKNIKDKNAKVTKVWLQDNLELALDILGVVFKGEFLR